METEGIEDARYSVVWRKHLHRLGGPSLEGYDSKCLLRHNQANVS